MEDTGMLYICKVHTDQGDCHSLAFLYLPKIRKVMEGKYLPTVSVIFIYAAIPTCGSCACVVELNLIARSKNRLENPENRSSENRS